MGYIGNEPTTGHFPVDNFTSSGGSTYTLAKAPASAGAIEVSVQGVLQPTTAYTVSGTTLTMAGVTSGVKIFVRHLGETLSLPTPADGSVTTAKLGTNSVTTGKIAAGAVELADMQSGTAGDTLYYNPAPTRLAKGTAAQVLTMNAGATAPEWAAAAGGSSMPIGASAHIGGSHQSVATGTTTKLAFNTELYDPNSNFNTTTYAYTVPSGQAGKYLVTAFAGVQALGDGKRVSVQIFKNNSLVMSPYVSASGAFSEYMSVTGVLDLAAADYIDIRGWHNKGSNADFSASAYDSVFSIQRIV